MSQDATSDRFGHAVDAVRRGVGAVRRTVPVRAVGERLVAAGDDRRRLWIGNSQAARRVAVFDALLRRSEAARHRDAGESLETARLALQIADSLRGEGRSAHAPLAARAWVHMAHAQRITEDLEESAAALGRAEAALRDDPASDPLFMGRVLTARASLLKMELRYEDALRVSRDARRVYGDRGRADLVDFMRVFEAGTLTAMGEERRSIDVGSDVLRQLDGASDPLLVSVASYNVGVALFHLRQGEATVRVMRSLLPLTDEMGLRRMGMRLRGMEGLALARLGRHRSAVRILAPLESEVRAVETGAFPSDVSTTLARSRAALARSDRPGRPGRTPTG